MVPTILTYTYLLNREISFTLRFYICQKKVLFFSNKYILNICSPTGSSEKTTIFWVQSLQNGSYWIHLIRDTFKNIELWRKKSCRLTKGVRKNRKKGAKASIDLVEVRMCLCFKVQGLLTRSVSLHDAFPLEMKIKSHTGWLLCPKSPVLSKTHLHVASNFNCVFFRRIACKTCQLPQWAEELGFGFWDLTSLATCLQSAYAAAGKSTNPSLRLLLQRSIRWFTHTATQNYLK